MSIEKYEIDSFKKESIPFEFTILPNIVLQNFTNESLCIWVHLMSLPPDWNINREYLMNKFDIGRDKLDRWLKTLLDHKLMEYERIRETDGTIRKVCLIAKNGCDYYKEIFNNQQHAKIKVEETSTTLKTHSVVYPLSGKTAPTNNIDNTNKTKKIKNKNPQPKKQVAVVSQELDFPDWLNKETWEDFKQHRKEIKKPMSFLAQKKTINQLTKMKEKGQDIDQVLNNSIANGWQGIFEIKQRKEILHGTSNVVLGKNGLECSERNWNSIQWDILKEGAGLSRDADLNAIEGLIPGEVWDSFPDPRRDISPSAYLEDSYERHLEEYNRESSGKMY